MRRSPALVVSRGGGQARAGLGQRLAPWSGWPSWEASMAREAIHHLHISVGAALWPLNPLLASSVSSSPDATSKGRRRRDGGTGGRRDGGTEISRQAPSTAMTTSHHWPPPDPLEAHETCVLGTIDLFRPRPSCPIWTDGASPSSIDLVGRLTCGWLPYSVQQACVCHVQRRRQLSCPRGVLLSSFRRSRPWSCVVLGWDGLFLGVPKGACRGGAEGWLMLGRCA